MLIFMLDLISGYLMYLRLVCKPVRSYLGSMTIVLWYKVSVILYNFKKLLFSPLSPCPELNCSVFTMIIAGEGGEL